MEKTRLLAAAMDEVTNGLNSAAGTAGFGGSETSMTGLIGNTINVVLGLLGIVSLVFIIYAGILYILSQGDKNKVETANKILTFSVIGMIIVVSAFAISNYLLGGLAAILGG